ncbi:hypothetical protein DFH06DRAFT_1147037 [Mycena polygramma]|nr:hypothetical protein DFH06DRAFT_1147037 [Mycena polygramma]
MASDELAHYLTNLDIDRRTWTSDEPTRVQPGLGPGPRWAITWRGDAGRWYQRKKKWGFFTVSFSPPRSQDRDARSAQDSPSMFEREGQTTKKKPAVGAAPKDLVRGRDALVRLGTVLGQGIVLLVILLLRPRRIADDTQRRPASVSRAPLHSHVARMPQNLDLKPSSPVPSDVLAWLGLQALALAWLHLALASDSSSQSQSHGRGLGLAWLWLEPWLQPNILNLQQPSQKCGQITSYHCYPWSRGFVRFDTPAQATACWLGFGFQISSQSQSQPQAKDLAWLGLIKPRLWLVGLLASSQAKNITTCTGPLIFQSSVLGSNQYRISTLPLVPSRLLDGMGSAVTQYTTVRLSLDRRSSGLYFWGRVFSASASLYYIIVLWRDLPEARVHRVDGPSASTRNTFGLTGLRTASQKQKSATMQVIPQP